MAIAVGIHLVGVAGEVVEAGDGPAKGGVAAQVEDAVTLARGEDVGEQERFAGGGFLVEAAETELLLLFVIAQAGADRVRQLAEHPLAAIVRLGNRVRQLEVLRQLHHPLADRI